MTSDFAPFWPRCQNHFPNTCHRSVLPVQCQHVEQRKCMREKDRTWGCCRQLLGSPFSLDYWYQRLTKCYLCYWMLLHSVYPSRKCVNNCFRFNSRSSGSCSVGVRGPSETLVSLTRRYTASQPQKTSTWILTSVKTSNLRISFLKALLHDVAVAVGWCTNFPPFIEP
jgi:hypothetical protein